MKALSQKMERPVSLADVLDRILYSGVAVEGEVTIGVGGVDLILLDLRLLLASVDKVQPHQGPPLPSPAPVAGGAAGRGSALAAAMAAPPAQMTRPAPETPGPRLFADRKATDGSLAKLVLGLANLLHEVLERQALRRMANGTLSDAEIEDLGVALCAQAQEIERMRRSFGLSDADLELRLAAAERLI
jgi:hypothetical protein